MKKDCVFLYRVGRRGLNLTNGELCPGLKRRRRRQLGVKDRNEMSGRKPGKKSRKKRSQRTLLGERNADIPGRGGVGRRMD